MDFVDFEWLVADGGHEWQNAHPIVDHLIQPHGGRYLTADFALTFKTTRPLRDAPALHRSLAEVELTEPGVVSFANEHGLLTNAVPIQSETEKGANGETMDLWMIEVLHMRHALIVWNAVRDSRRGSSAGRKAAGKLARWFQLRPDDEWSTVVYKPDEPWVAGVPQEGIQFIGEKLGTLTRYIRNASEPTNRPVPSTPEGLAVAWIRSILNGRLGTHTSARAMYPADATGQPHLALQIIPRNLLGAIWFQFARELEGGRDYRRCALDACGKWIELSPDLSGKRIDAKFCSTPCRVRAYRKRGRADQTEPRRKTRRGPRRRPPRRVTSG